MTDQNEDNTEAKVKKAECSQCGGERNCDIIGNYDDMYSDEHMDACTSWYLMKCRGCDHVFVQTVSGNSEDYDFGYDETGQETMIYHETIKYWPALSKRKKPEWISDYGAIEVPNTGNLDEALAELYSALNNDLYALASIGVRTAFDIAAELLGVDPEETFASKLKNLVKEGHIGKVDKERLEVLVEAGGASAHRGWKPNAKELSLLMDILESFLYHAFVLPHRKTVLEAETKKMKAAIPPRKKKRPEKKT